MVFLITKRCVLKRLMGYKTMMMVLMRTMMVHTMAELLMRTNCKVEMIRRAETPKDYFTTFDFEGSKFKF